MNIKVKKTYQNTICVKKAREHNLKAVSCSIPHSCLVCLTGVSGSGKSSFAFDTLYAEAQRRYLLSLSHQTKRLLEVLPKPDVEQITGLTPTVAIKQISPGTNPRSTVGTITEIHEYLRLLFSRFAIPHCPESGEPLIKQDKESLLRETYDQFLGHKITIFAPFPHEKTSSLKEKLLVLEKKGYTRIRLNNENTYRIDEVDVDTVDPSSTLDVLIDRLTVQDETKTRFLESISLALEEGHGTFYIDETAYSLYGYSKATKKTYPALDPQDFSFNSPSGMCVECQGLGQKQQFILSKIIDPTKSIREDCCLVASSYNTVRYKNIYDNLASLYGFSVNTPWEQLSDDARHVFLYGTEKKWTRMVFIHPKTGATWYDNIQWRGVLYEALFRYSQATSARFRQNMEQFMHLDTCPSCHGGRIKPYPLASKFKKKSIFELSIMTIDEALFFFQECDQTNILIQQCTLRLGFLHKVGLGYLTLDRSAPTLSGGEIQRVRLAGHLGSGLTGLTYILDEPSIGLHPRDNEKLLGALRSLQQQGNSVIIVEHDEETIRSSDFVIDFGPLAGIHGGEIVFAGPTTSLLTAPNSLTGTYLSGEKTITRNAKFRPLQDKKLTLTQATLHNLRGDTLTIPLERFTAITGVSGSGKSSLILETLYPALSNKIMGSILPVGPYESLIGTEHVERVIAIDQTPIGRTPRSNPATYIKLFDDIRKLFASLPESKAKGWDEGRFSFNVKEGTCPECEGMGQLQIDMDFLEPAWMECPVCHGGRFDTETLTVRWKGKSIKDVLSMTVDEAFFFFEELPYIAKKIQILRRVGLGYVQLGQPSNTLSGGEAQRIKIAKELSRPEIKRTLYLLDEPTTGLHFHDIQALIDVLHELVDRQNTVVVIEHNMDLVKTADWIIDMGPESGQLGGKITAQGTLEEVRTSATPTGMALRKGTVPISSTRTIPSQASEMIETVGARQNNLKNLSFSIPKNAITALIGPSGSGKSSLAFETIHAEGEGRFIESLSPYIRQFMKIHPRSKVDSISGLLSTIALERKYHMVNPRSTVGTTTEIYDYLRILWARLGIPHCPKSNKPLLSISKESLVDQILELALETKVEILAPLGTVTKKELSVRLESLRAQGYNRVEINGVRYDLFEENRKFNEQKTNTLKVLIDRAIVKPENKSRFYSSIQEAYRLSKNQIELQNGEKTTTYSLAFCSPETGEIFPEITSQTFAFNTHAGMCPECKGLGFQWGLDIEKLSLSKDSSPADLCSLLLGEEELSELPSLLSQLERAGIHPCLPITSLSLQEKQKLFYGTKCSKRDAIEWVGITQAIENGLKQFENEENSFDEQSFLRQALREQECSSCRGTRLNELARHVTIQDLSIAQFSDLSIVQAIKWLKKNITVESLSLPLQNLFHEIEHRLMLLESIGLGYLTLSRTAHSLSHGEAQRVKLLSQVGSKLSHITYILDEPTAGLSRQDSQKVYSLLRKLQANGNGIIAIEHDLNNIVEADWIIELGPRGGKDGGSLLFQGSSSDWQRSKESVTLPYLHKTYPSSSYITSQTPPIEVQKAKEHNLKNLSLSLPTNSLVTIIGPSGSGKSTLLFDVIGKAYKEKTFCSLSSTQEVTGLDQFQQLVEVEQSSHGITSRSDLGSYIDVLAILRSFYASLSQSLQLGLESRHFSPNVRKGMCTHCWGMGYKKIDMLFLAPTYTPCPECHGMRLNKLSLSVEYKGISFGAMLQLPLVELLEKFEHLPRIKKRIAPLLDLGLGYLTLGQELSTLSNGELQRVKIAKECWKGNSRTTLFLLDEPTTGLHAREVESVITMLKTLQQKGHSIIAIEHNERYIASSDWILELGPGAGDEGGHILYNGRADGKEKRRGSNSWSKRVKRNRQSTD